MEIIYYPANPGEAGIRGLYNPTAGYKKNTYKDVNGHLVRGQYCTLEEIKDLLPYTFCFDVGAANICGMNAYSFILGLGDKLGMVVIRENDGHTDQSLLPFSFANNGCSYTDWCNIGNALKKIDFNGTIVIDYFDAYKAAPPLLRSDLFTYVRKIGEYFRWQLTMGDMVANAGERILFGAGNMCRNYMRVYGEKYPPKFIVDNNPASWGTKRYGIEIFSPAELLKVDPTITVFICSTFYEEMAAQLKGMGVKNPIAYFNDEYISY